MALDVVEYTDPACPWAWGSEPKFRRLRAERGLSQEALGHECGINRTYLSSVERSERNVSIDNIARIAEALGVEASLLLRDDR